MKITVAALKDNFVLHFAVLLAVVVVLCGTRAPFDNEYIYLLRLATAYDPTFLANDFSFSAPASEHWVFNHVFGPLTFFLSIESIAYVGRIACWSGTLIALIRLGRHWEIPIWMVSAAILIWVCQGQAVIGGEWVIGSFEAKTIAYPLLLFAIDGLLRRKIIYPAVLLGSSFSFHPAIGLWAMMAVGVGMFWAGWTRREIATAAGLALIFSLPGGIPLLLQQSSIATAGDWQFYELVRMPQFFDLVIWPKASIILLYLQLAFCGIALGKGGERRRLLLGFIAALGMLFTLGLILRIVGAWQLLQTMPMRLFPVFVGLFFFYSLASAYKEGRLGPPFRALAALALACLLLTPNPLANAYATAQLTFRTWADERDDNAVCFDWVRENTPANAVFIASPWRKDFWHRARRAQVVSGGFPTYMDLGEWRERDHALTGESLENRPTSERDGRADFYHSITKEKMYELAAKYGADHIVTEAEYPYELLFQSGRSKVYRIR